MRNPGNDVTLSGNLTRDPEIVDVGDGGTQQLRFSIGVNKAGSQRDTSGFFEIRMWLNENDYSAVADIRRARADVTEGRLVKGARVTVTGRLQHDTWTDKESGGNRSSVSVVADGIQVATFNKTDSDTAGTAKNTATAGASSNVPESF